MHRLSLLLFSLVLWNTGLAAQDNAIPDFGDGKSVTLDQEYYLGRAWLTSFRRQVTMLNDAQVQSYVEGIVYRLATSSRLKDRRLEIVVVKNKSANAFAVSGGIVGVHSGLLLEAENESQFASVLSHELAHLSQRHFLQGLQARNKSLTVGMTGLLNDMVSIATTSPVAAKAGGGRQAPTLSGQLRYSRVFESEADTLGLQNLASAGLDPGGAPGMLMVLQQNTPEYDIPAGGYLYVHRLSEARIRELSDRAAAYPSKVYEDNRLFQLMRSRVELNFFEDPGDAVTYFREKQKRGGKNRVANQYGLIIALTKNADFDEARALLKPMREFAPSNIVYALAEANIDIEDEQFDAAIERLEELLRLTPKNHPITMYLSKAYYFAGRYADAAEVLSRHSRTKPDDAYLWYLLALDREQAGDMVGAHQARAENLRLTGDIQQGIDHLNQALRLAERGVNRERIKSRLAHFQKVAAALQQL